LFYGNLQVVRILVSHPSIDVNLSYRGGHDRITLGYRGTYQVTCSASRLF
jgi:hypothetical protein